MSIASRSLLFFFHFLLFSPILSIYRFSSLLLFSRLTRFSFLSFHIYLHIDMQLLYYDVVGKKREPDRLSVTDPKYNFIILISYCEKHAFKYIIHIRWYCITGNDKRIERKLRKTLIPLVSLSKYASAIYHVLLSRYEEIVIRHFDSASQILHIYLGNRSSNCLITKKQKEKYCVFRLIKYTYMCVCVCARVYVFVCVYVLVYIGWMKLQACCYFFFFNLFPT